MQLKAQTQEERTALYFKLMKYLHRALVEEESHVALEHDRRFGDEVYFGNGKYGFVPSKGDTITIRINGGA
jgi:hypothetical protein